MEKRICLITGATSGIGKATATELARKGFHVVVTYRNSSKGEQTINEIKQITGSELVEGMEVDLESFDSIRKMAADFKNKYPKIDVLINNAGIWETKRFESKDGIEKTIAVNHLAPFLLTNLLLDWVKKGNNPRIVNVSSEAHRYANIDFEDIECKKKFGSMKAYGQSKLANILFTKKLAKMLEGTGITVNCLHPGVVNTNLFDKFPSFMKSMMSGLLLTPEKGARTSIFLATSDEFKSISGQYFAKMKMKKSNDTSNNSDAAEKLWDISKDYVGLK